MFQLPSKIGTVMKYDFIIYRTHNIKAQIRIVKFRSYKSNIFSLLPIISFHFLDSSSTSFLYAWQRQSAQSGTHSFRSISLLPGEIDSRFSFSRLINTRGKCQTRDDLSLFLFNQSINFVH